MAYFDEKAEAVIRNAKVLAANRGAIQVGDIDILYSLLEHHEDPVIQSLLGSRLKPSMAWGSTAPAPGQTSSTSLEVPDLPWSREAVEVLSRARKIAKGRRSYQAGIEDILFGLREINGKAAKIIRELTQKIIWVYIRWMIRRDMPEVMAVEDESFEFPWLEEDFICCLRGRNIIGMVAEYRNPAVRKEPVVGFMIYALFNNRIKILNFAVAKKWRRRCVGSQMVAKLIGKLSAQCRTRITLDVRETNLPAQLFFKANKFRAVSVLWDFYKDTPEDAYLMQYSFRTDPETPNPPFQPTNRIAHLAG